MNERLPDNLALLYSAFSEGAIESILPGDTFYVDGVEFVCKYAPGSTADRFYIVKNLELVERYRYLSERFAGGAIVVASEGTRYSPRFIGASSAKSSPR